MDLLRTEGEPSRGTQVRYHPLKIYCYPLKLDAAETETIAGSRDVRSNKDSVIFSSRERPYATRQNKSR